MTSSGLPAKFPEDLWLQQIGAESYIGVPMRNAQGRTLAHFAVLHQEPMEPSEEDIAVLQIFAARGCAELERKQAHEKLSKAHEDLRRLNLETTALLNVNRAIGHHLNRDVCLVRSPIACKRWCRPTVSGSSCLAQAVS